jgi:hypothetical protein
MALPEQTLSYFIAKGIFCKQIWPNQPYRGDFKKIFKNLIF